MAKCWFQYISIKLWYIFTKDLLLGTFQSGYARSHLLAPRPSCSGPSNSSLLHRPWGLPWSAPLFIWRLKKTHCGNCYKMVCGWCSDGSCCSLMFIATKVTATLLWRHWTVLCGCWCLEQKPHWLISPLRLDLLSRNAKQVRNSLTMFNIFYNGPELLRCSYCSNL